jgi:hypothetical protein
MTVPRLSTSTERNLNRQGFVNLDQEAKACYSLPLRFTPGIGTALIAIGLVLHSAIWLGSIALVALSGALLPSGMVIDQVYNLGVRHLFRAPALPPTPKPRQFSYLLSTGLLVGSALCFYYGLSMLGFFLGGMVLIGGTILTTTLWCLGSWFYRLVFGSAAAKNSRHCHARNGPGQETTTPRPARGTGALFDDADPGGACRLCRVRSDFSGPMGGCHGRPMSQSQPSQSRWRYRGCDRGAVPLMAGSIMNAETANMAVKSASANCRREPVAEAAVQLDQEGYGRGEFKHCKQRGAASSGERPRDTPSPAGGSMGTFRTALSLIPLGVCSTC